MCCLWDGIWLFSIIAGLEIVQDNTVPWVFSNPRILCRLSTIYKRKKASEKCLCGGDRWALSP